MKPDAHDNKYQLALVELFSSNSEWQGSKISDVVSALARSCNVPDSKARYIIRRALDGGYVRTDSKFKLHLT
jgi:hypothetical protein